MLMNVEPIPSVSERGNEIRRLIGPPVLRTGLMW
jgi:hypothetical protein